MYPGYNPAYRAYGSGDMFRPSYVPGVASAPPGSAQVAFGLVAV